LLWKGIFNGVELVAVKGNIVKIRRDKYLEYTTIDPNSDVPDLPENYLTVIYELAEEKDKTELTISQGDYGSVAEGGKRYQEAIDGGGWSTILVEIKKLVEEKD
jgi:hypothetical protein